MSRFALLALFLAVPLVGAAQQSPNLSQKLETALALDPNLEASPYTALVRFRPEVPMVTQERRLTAWGGRLVRRSRWVTGLVVVETPSSPLQFVASVRRDPAVRYAEPDFLARLARVPNDPSFGLQFGFQNTGQALNWYVGKPAEDANFAKGWDYIRDATSTPVAVLDTGCQIDHPDLQANIYTNPGEVPANGIDDDNNGYIDDVHGWDFASGDNDVSDTDGHGTHTAGTIGAVSDNGIGVAGCAWKAKVVPLRFIGSGANTISAAIEAIEYCMTMGIRVSSNSWGLNNYSQALYDTVAASLQAGHLFVAAAGNQNLSLDQWGFYPAGFDLDNVLSVAATNNRGYRASFSNYGANGVDIGAPGEDVYSTIKGSSYAYNSGTSMATPHVSGAATLLMALKPNWSWRQVKYHLMATSRPCRDLNGITQTGGTLNAGVALYPFQTKPNEPPTVVVSQPWNGATVLANSTVTLRCLSWDHFDGDRSDLTFWRSDIQGNLGRGRSVTVSLSPGVHIISAVAPDTKGQLGGRTLTVVATDDTTLPAKPLDFVAQLANGTRRVEMAWNLGSANSLWFEVQRQVNYSGNWFDSTSWKPYEPTWQDVPFNGRFRYRVRAVNATGVSDWTDWIEVIQS